MMNRRQIIDRRRFRRPGGLHARLRVASLALCGAVLLTGSAESASGQVIQLPSVGTFSYHGSVAVPDGGSASLGSLSSRYYYGQPRARVLSSGATTGSAVVDAQVIDHQKMDRQVLGRANARLGRGGNRPMTMNSVAPVAGIYALPEPGEVSSEPAIGEMRLGRSRGDYLRILSHPAEANRSPAAPSSAAEVEASAD